MSHRENAAMKEALLCVSVTPMERTVLLDMAQALAPGSTLYTWGHDRLALAIGKKPRSTAAKRALSGRIFPSITAKRLVVKTRDAHRGSNAEYDLIVLHGRLGAPRMGTGSGARMGTGSGQEWVPVPDGMGTAQTGTPPTTLRQPLRPAAARPQHKHHDNALRALTTLAADLALPVPVAELMDAAYLHGAGGDPWIGYRDHVRPACERPFTGVTNQAAALRARLRLPAPARDL